MNKLIATTTAAALLAGTAAVTVTAAHADGPERNAYGRIAGGHYEISVEKERGFEVDADLDAIPANSRWRMVVWHDGRKVATRTAASHKDDGRHEVDFGSVHRPDSAGKDSFKVKIKRTDGAGKVVRTLTFAS